MRGFIDLGRLERAEAWRGLKGELDFAFLQGLIPRLLEAERRWEGWDAFRALHAPRDLADAVRTHQRTRFVIEGMSPALGERLTRLWRRAVERGSAASIERYLAERPDAPDFFQALERLVAIYGGESSFRWEVVSADAARRLEKIGALVLERYPDSALRPAGLACRALAANAKRPAGRLDAAAATTIRTALAEVLERFPESPFAAPAIEGLVRTEAETGRTAEAEAAYAAFRGGHVGNVAVLEDVRNRLGRLGLRVGGLPEFRAADLDGTEVTNTSLRGKVVVVDFWATWCRPCVDGLSALRRIAERHGERVVVLGVNLDLRDETTADDLKAWVARENVPGRHLFDGRGWESDLVKAFGVTEIPFTAVVDARGKVVALDEHGKQLEKAVQAAVGGGEVRTAAR